MYSPFAPLCTSRVAWVASLMSVTVAAATEAPLGSLIVPRMRPPVLCAPANGAVSKRVSTRTNGENVLRRQCARLCQNPAVDFMTSPLIPKNSLGSGFFEVAAPPKPYYNPVNLEKAGCSVKRKEFLQAISNSNGTPLAAHQRGGAPRGDFLFRSSRLGRAGPRLSAAHEDPLPYVRRGRCATVAARSILASRTRTESPGHRPRIETPGRRFGAGRERSTS